MQNQTQDVLTSVLGEEFKIEVEKRDKILASLNNQKDTVQKEIDCIKEELKELSIRKSGLQDDINLAYQNKEEELKNAKDSFEQSKTNTISSLEDREKLFDKNVSEHEKNVNVHNGNVAQFNKEKVDFINRKKAIVETLSESLKIHTDLLSDAILAIKEPFQEEKQESEPENE